MKITSIVASAILASTAVAAPAAEAAQLNGPFTAISSHSTSAVHLLQLTANGFQIQLAGTTKSFCPASVQPNCPPGKATAFQVDNATGRASMNTEVPGGQTLYVAKTGELMYTVAHSGAIPAGAYTTGFKRTAPGSNGLGIFSFTAGGATSFFGCANKDGVYEVVANVKGRCVEECISFGALSSAYKNGPAAWEYE